ERGSPATFAVCEKRDLEAERFQNCDGSDPDVWFVITDKSVVPENHPAALVFARARLMPNEPAIKALPRVMRQCPFRRKSEGFFHDRAEWRKIERCICDGRQRATEPAQEIDRAQYAHAQRQAIALMARVDQLRFEQREVDVRMTLRRTVF